MNILLEDIRFWVMIVEIGGYVHAYTREQDVWGRGRGVMVMIKRE